MDRASDQSHVAAVGVASGRQESLLRDDDVIGDVDVVLIMKPHTLADPRPVTDMQLPRKLHARARAENDAVTYLGPEGAEHPTPNP